MKFVMTHGEVEVRDPVGTHGDPEVFITVDEDYIKEKGAWGLTLAHVIIKRKDGTEGRVHLSLNAPLDLKVKANMRVVHRTGEDVVRSGVVAFTNYNKPIE